MNIDEISTREFEAISIMHSVEGTLDEIDVQLRQRGVYEAYAKIFKDYANISYRSIEAVKRSLFLMWSAMVEPPMYSGINVLSETDVRKMFDALDKLLSQEIDDYELRWMISYYADWEFVFNSCTEYPNIMEALNLKNKAKIPERIYAKEMENRGTMGRYFLTLNITY